MDLASTLPSKADMCSAIADVRFVPKADKRTAANSVSTRNALQRGQNQVTREPTFALHSVQPQQRPVRNLSLVEAALP
jgi:hypothetical protein